MNYFSKSVAAAACAVPLTLGSVTAANAVTINLANKWFSPQYVKTTSYARYAVVHKVGTGGGTISFTIQHGTSYTTKARLWGIYSAPGPNQADGLYLSSASISCY